MEDEDDDALVDRLPEDLLVHIHVEERRRLLIGLAIEQSGARRIGSQRQSSERVHDNVDPQQLDGRQRAFLVCTRDSCNERDDDCSDVDRNLELKEFAHGIVHAPASHDSLDNRGEVIVHEDNI